MTEAFVIRGIMSPENRVLDGRVREKHYYPPEKAREEAQVLSQEIEHSPRTVHIIEGHLDRPNGSPTVDDIIGKVTGADYQEGAGVCIRGEIVDPQIAMALERGVLGISPEIAHTLGELDESKAAKPVETIMSVLRVAVVGAGQPGTAVEVAGKVSLADATAPSESPVGDGDCP